MLLNDSILNFLLFEENSETTKINCLEFIVSKTPKDMPYFIRLTDDSGSFVATNEKGIYFDPTIKQYNEHLNWYVKIGEDVSQGSIKLNK